jgi:hypothetical protein
MSAHRRAGAGSVAVLVKTWSDDSVRDAGSTRAGRQGKLSTISCEKGRFWAKKGSFCPEISSLGVDYIGLKN